jgi:hypothetical protein
MCVREGCYAARSPVGKQERQVYPRFPSRHRQCGLCSHRSGCGVACNRGLCNCLCCRSRVRHRVRVYCAGECCAHCCRGVCPSGAIRPDDRCRCCCTVGITRDRCVGDVVDVGLEPCVRRDLTQWVDILRERLVLSGTPKHQQPTARTEYPGVPDEISSTRGGSTFAASTSRLSPGPRRSADMGVYRSAFGRTPQQHGDESDG